MVALGQVCAEHGALRGRQGVGSHRALQTLQGGWVMGQKHVVAQPGEDRWWTVAGTVLGAARSLRRGPGCGGEGALEPARGCGQEVLPDDLTVGEAGVGGGRMEERPAGSRARASIEEEMHWTGAPGIRGGFDTGPQGEWGVKSVPMSPLSRETHGGARGREVAVVCTLRGSTGVSVAQGRPGSRSGHLQERGTQGTGTTAVPGGTQGTEPGRLVKLSPTHAPNMSTPTPTVTLTLTQAGLVQPHTPLHTVGELRLRGRGLPRGLGEFDLPGSWTLGPEPHTLQTAGPTSAWPLCASGGRRLRRSTEGLMTELPRAEATPPPGTKRFQILLRVALSVPLIRSIHPEPVSFFLCMPALGRREPAPGAPRGHPGLPPAQDGAGPRGRG